MLVEECFCLFRDVKEKYKLNQIMKEINKQQKRKTANEMNEQC